MRWLPKSPRVRRILLAYALNELGTWFGYVALSLAVYEATHSAAAVAGLLVVSRLLPSLMVPALVARVETSRRRGELSALYLVQATATTALAFLVVGLWLPAVLLLVMIDGAAALTAGALLHAEATRAEVTHAELMHQVHPNASTAAQREERSARSASGALSSAYTVALILGPALAGATVGAWGPQAALLVDAASFLLAAGLLRDLHPHIDEAGDSVRRRLRTAWTHLQGTPQLSRLLTIEALAIIFFASAEPVEVIYTKSTLAAGDRGYGLLLATWGLGMAFGSVIAGASKQSLRALLIGGTAAIGVGYLGFAIASTLLLACIAAVVGGIGTGMQWASLLSAVQILTPAGLRGRMMGALQSINALCPALGFAVGGALAALSSPRAAFLTAGGASCLLTMLFVFGTRNITGTLPPDIHGVSEEASAVL